MLSKLMQAWLVSDRVIASGRSRALKCPALVGVAQFQAFGNIRAMAHEGNLFSISLVTGPTEEGPWTAIASAEASPTNLNSIIPFPSDKLKEYVAAEWKLTLDDNETADGGEVQILCSVLGEMRYSAGAVSIGGDTLDGQPALVDLTKYSLLDGPTDAITPTDGTPDPDDAESIDIGVPESDAIIVFDTKRVTGTNAEGLIAVFNSDDDETFELVANGAVHIFYINQADCRRYWKAVPYCLLNGDDDPTFRFDCLLALKRSDVD